MNCDEAFDALTDPAEHDNSALKWHLEFCPRCREMQEVLAPALALFAGEPDPGRPDEDAFPQPARRLPELFPEENFLAAEPGEESLHSPAPFLTPEAVRVAEQTARTLQPSRRRLSQRWFQFIAAGMACTLASIVILFAAGSPEPQPPSQPDSMMLADRCLWTERNDERQPPPTEEPSSRWVVLSCVSCHLEKSLE